MRSARMMNVEVPVMLAFAMVVLGLATFAAMVGFVKLCDRV